MEDVQEMASAGMKWLGLNVGDGHSWDDWIIVRQRAAAASPAVEVIPWRRCLTLSILDELLALAKTNGCDYCIPNLENELETVCPPDEVSRGIRASGYMGEIGISTVAWLYNGVDYRPLVHLPVLLQLFVADMRRDPSEIPTLVPQCVSHARDKGFTWVGVTYQTYAGAKPEWYDRRGTHSFFTGDDLGAGNWARWAA